MALSPTVAEQIRDMARRAPEVEALRLRALAMSVERLERSLAEAKDKLRAAVMDQLNHRCAPQPCPECERALAS